MTKYLGGAGLKVTQRDTPSRWGTIRTHVHTWLAPLATLCCKWSSFCWFPLLDPKILGTDSVLSSSRHPTCNVTAI